MSWRATGISLLVQLVVTGGLAAAAAGLWAMRNGQPWLAMWSNWLFIAGALWLLGGGTIMSKATSNNYAKFGIAASTRTVTGDDVRTRASSRLTAFGEAIVIATACFGTALALM